MKKFIEREKNLQSLSPQMTEMIMKQITIQLFEIYFKYMFSVILADLYMIHI